MKKILSLIAAGLLLMSFLPAAEAADEALVASKSLSPEAALEVAQGALKKCRASG